MHVETTIFQGELQTIIILNEEETLKEYRNLLVRRRNSNIRSWDYLNTFLTKLRTSLINIEERKIITDENI